MQDHPVWRAASDSAQHTAHSVILGLRAAHSRRCGARLVKRTRYSPSWQAAEPQRQRQMGLASNRRSCPYATDVLSAVEIFRARQLQHGGVCSLTGSAAKLEVVSITTSSTGNRAALDAATRTGTGRCSRSEQSFACSHRRNRSAGTVQAFEWAQCRADFVVFAQESRRRRRALSMGVQQRRARSVWPSADSPEQCEVVRRCGRRHDAQPARCGYCARSLAGRCDGASRRHQHERVLDGVRRARSPSRRTASWTVAADDRLS